MRYHEIIEGWLGSVDPGGDHLTDVYLDPTRGEIARMLKASEWHILRAMLGPKHFYVWDAYGFVHSMLPKDLIQSGDEAVSLTAFERQDDDPVRAVNVMIDVHGPYLPAQDFEVAPDGLDDPDVEAESTEKVTRARVFCDHHPMMHRAFGPSVRVTVRDDGLR